MSSFVIDQAVHQTIALYYGGAATVEAVTQQIAKTSNPEATVHQLVQEIFNLGEGKPCTLNIQMNDRIVDLYGTLSSMYESSISAPRIEKAAMKYFDPQQQLPQAAAGRALNASALLSRLLATNNIPLSEKNFEAIKPLVAFNDPLQVCISANTPALQQSLVAAQNTLGPITALKIEYTRFTKEELVSIISCCPGLAHLSVTGALHFDDQVVAQATLPENLSELVVSNTAITSAGLQLACQKCPQLRMIDVQGCAKISQTDLAITQYPKSLLDIYCDSFWKTSTDYTELVDLAHQEQSAVAFTLAGLAVYENEEADKLEAQKLLEAALNINPQFFPAAIAYAEFFRVGAHGIKASPLAARAQVDTLLENFPNHHGLMACKARLMSDDGELEEAQKIAQSAYKQAPYNHYVLATFADILRKVKNQALAETLCERATILNPRNAHALVCLANLRATTQPANAEQLYREAVKINFYNQAALQGLALLLLEKKGSADEAKRLLETAIQANPDAALAHFYLAKLHQGEFNGINKNCEMALHHFQQAYAHDPKNIRLLTAYGEFLRTGEKNDLAKSQKLLEEAASLLEAKEPLQKKTKASAFEVDTSLASILMDDIAGDAEDRARALVLCEQAYSTNSNDPFLLSMLGELLLSSDSVRGIQYLEHVINNHKECVPALIALANFYAVKNPSRANELLTKALKIAPKDLLANIARAKLALTHNRHDDAKKYVVTALEIDPNCAQALVLQARLLVTAQVYDNVNATLEYILNKTKFGFQTRQDIVVLLCEHPELLEEKRQEVLRRLSQG